MNKKALWIGIAVVLVLAVAWGVMASRKQSTSEKGVGLTSDKQEKTDTGKLTSLKELQAIATPQKCTFNDESSAEKAQGLVYVSKGKMRGDFGMISQGKAVVTHMITDGKYSYTWLDGSTTGFKAAMDAPKTENRSGSTGVDADKQVNYNCQGWSEDPAMFTAPSNVKFEDFSAFTAPQAPQGGAVQPAGSSAAACAACDSLEGDSKTQCRTALSCK